MAVLRSLLRSAMVFPLGMTLMAQSLVSASNATNSTNVLLTPLIGTGLLPKHLEDGLVLSAGPRFTNALYAPDTNGSVGGCFGCLVTVAREIPCIYEAIKNKDPKDLLNCGVSKSGICDCLSCLPDSLQPYVQAFCGDGSLDNILPITAMANATFSDTDDYDIEAFLGTMPDDVVKYVQEQNEAGCKIGQECGNVCCIGACVSDKCVGFTTVANGPTCTPTAKYGQCGGTGWTGCTDCVAGSTCTYTNQFFSQCLQA